MMVRAMAGCCAFVRWSSVLVLAGAAAGKALALRHGPIGEGWLAVPALALALVGYEATLAAWLMLGRAVVMGQLVAFVTFAGFGAYSLGLALDGARTCRCFGILSVPPHVTAAVDFALAVGWLLMVLDGQRGPAPVRSGRMAGCMACLVCLVPLGVAAWHVAGYYGVLSGLHGRLVVLEPDDLLGRRADFLAHAPGGQQLLHGRWRVLVVRAGCDRCRAAMEQEFGAHAGSLAAVRRALLELPAPGRQEPWHTAVPHVRLPDDRTWYAPTPMVLELDEGTIVAASRPAVGYIKGLAATAWE